MSVKLCERGLCAYEIIYVTEAPLAAFQCTAIDPLKESADALPHAHDMQVQATGSDAIS